MKDIYIYILCCICSAYLEASSFQESKGFQEYRTVLSIAGSDPSGGAGIQADLKTFSALQCYGMSAITALTAQNTVGVQAIQSLPSPFITAQLKSIFEDIKVNSVKIGMLERVEVIQAVADYLNTYWKDQGPIVVDPVMFAKSGDQLIEDEAIEALKETILPLATILTPNIHEACRLLRISQITTKLEMEEAAFALLELGPEAVVLKGAKGKDCLVMKGDIQPYWLEHEYILTSNVHGTGCAFSAAIASYLAQGEDIFNSVKKGKIYISKAIEGGSRYKLGKGKGPVLHFFSWSPSHFTESAWNGVDSIYDKIKHHTFIQEMGLGLLSKDRFSFYIAQDYLFLLDRSIAFSILASKAPTQELKEYLDLLSNGSRESAINIFNKYNLPFPSPTELIKTPACKRYTEEMLQIASQKSFKEGLVFLLPCAVIYQKIGEYLSSITPSVNSYSCWIAHYGSTEKQQKVEGLIHIVDQLVASCSKDEIQDLKEVFCKAALYELDFWEDAYQRMSWP